MAIQGTFLADFSNFTAAVAKAEVSLKAFEGDANKVETALNRATNALGGVKIVQQATIAAEAVARLGGDAGIAGGLLKLTDAELRKLGATAQEASEKLRAMGKDVPAGIQQISDAAKAADKATSSWMGNFSSQIKATALGFISAQAVIGGVQKAFGALTQFIGESVDAFSKQEQALKRMTTALQAQGQATPQVITQYKNLATQFQSTTVFADELITEMQALLVQVGNVMPKDMERALKASTDLASGLGIDLRTATLLVGKAFEGETGTLKRYGIVIDEARLKAEGMPAVLDAIQQKFGGQAAAEVDTYAGKLKQLANQWDELKEAVGKSIVQDEILKFGMGELSDKLRGVAGSADKAGSSFLELWSNIATGSETNALIIRQLQELVSLHNAFRDAPKPPPAPPPPTTFARPNQFGQGIGDVSKYLEEQEKLLKAQEKAAKEAAEVTARMAAARVPLKQAQIEQIDLWVKEGQAVSDMAKKLRVSEVPIRSYIDAQKALGKEIEEATARAEKSAKMQADLEQFIRKESIDLQKKHTAAFIAEEQKRALASSSSLDKQLAAFNEYQEKNYQATLEGSDLRIRQIEVEHQKALDALGVRFDAESAMYAMAKAEIDKYYLNLADQATKSTNDVKKAVGDLSQALSSLAQIAGGSFGAVVAGMASLVGAADAAIKAVDTLKKGMDAFKSKDILDGILGMSTGILGIVSAAISAGRAIAGLFDRNKGRDLVEDFAKSFGGFDALQKQLELLGDEGATLWVKLTQGVGRNNPEQATRVIAEVEAALAKYKSTQDAMTITSEAGAQATIETAAQAALALDEVNAKLITNAEAWGAWSKDVTGYLQKLADEIRSLPLPGPTGAMGGATLSPAAKTSGFASSMTSASQKISVYLDGAVLAQKTVTHMPAELSLNGF